MEATRTLCSPRSSAMLPEPVAGTLGGEFRVISHLPVHGLRSAPIPNTRAVTYSAVILHDASYSQRTDQQDPGWFPSEGRDEPTP